MSSNARQQARRENALKRLISHVPLDMRIDWTRDDYMNELRASEPTLFRAVVGSAEERFLRVQKVIPMPSAPKGTSIIMPPPPSKHHEHAPYVEELDKSAQKLRDHLIVSLHQTRSMIVKKGELFISASYQRDSIDNHRVEKIAAELDMRAFGTLTVAFRDGKYWIVDGQHRWLAAMQHIEIVDIPCVVFDSHSVQEEAHMFTLMNMARATVTPSDKYRALVAAEDATAVWLRDVLAIMGVTVVRTASSANHLAAISYVFAMAKRNFDNCETVLLVVQDVCDGQLLHGDLIKALDYLHTRIEGGISQPLLVTQLKRIGAYRLMDIIKKAKSTRYGAREQMGVLVLNAINQRLAAHKKFMLKEL